MTSAKRTPSGVLASSQRERERAATSACLLKRGLGGASAGGGAATAGAAKPSAPPSSTVRRLGACLGAPQCKAVQCMQAHDGRQRSHVAKAAAERPEDLQLPAARVSSADTRVSGAWRAERVSVSPACGVCHVRSGGYALPGFRFGRGPPNAHAPSRHLARRAFTPKEHPPRSPLRGLQAHTAPRAALAHGCPPAQRLQQGLRGQARARPWRPAARQNKPDVARPVSYATPSLRRALRGPRVRSVAAHGAVLHARTPLTPGCRVLTP